MNQGYNNFNDSFSSLFHQKIRTGVLNQILVLMSSSSASSVSDWALLTAYNPSGAFTVSVGRSLALRTLGSIVKRHSVVRLSTSSWSIYICSQLIGTTNTFSNDSRVLSQSSYTKLWADRTNEAILHGEVMSRTS